MRYLKFDSLPANVREKLWQRLNGDGESIVVDTSSLVSSIIIASAAILWFGLLLILTNNYLWSKTLTIIFAVISLVAAYFLVEHLYRLFRRFASRTRNHLLITPSNVIEINFNDLRYSDLEQLTAVNSSHQYRNRIYQFTEIKLDFENEAKIFKIKNLQAAEEAIDRINHWRKLYIEATARGDAAYLSAHNDFQEIEGRDDKLSVETRNDLFRRAAVSLTTIILTTAIMFGALSLNRYFDDKKSWEAAKAANSAASFRYYLRTHSDGLWRDDANQKLLSFYDAAREKYQTSLNKGYDQKAAEAILSLLEYAKTTQSYRVKTVFERRNEIPADIVEKLKNDYEVKKILPLDDSFSDEKMKRRESLLLTFIADAFRQIIPADVLEISEDCSGECATFLIKYTIDSDSIYFNDREKDVPDAERTYKPGIFINWDFGIKIPNQTDSYNFDLTSDPAEDISYDRSLDAESEAGKNITEILSAERSDVYEAMATSAFEDFKKNLIFRMGIGELPKSATGGDFIKGEKISPTVLVKPKQH